MPCRVTQSTRVVDVADYGEMLRCGVGPIGLTYKQKEGVTTFVCLLVRPTDGAAKRRCEISLCLRPIRYTAKTILATSVQLISKLAGAPRIVVHATRQRPSIIRHKELKTTIPDNRGGATADQPTTAGG